MNRRTLFLVIGIVVASNLFALIHAAWNRSGGPMQTIQLTDRELPVSAMDQDNTGVNLSLSWRHTQATAVRGTWGPEFDSKRLEELGFDRRQLEETGSGASRLLSREVFAALEYNGDAWDRWVAEMEEARIPATPGTASGSLERQQRASRLFLVDVSRSAAELRNRYPGQGRCLITRAVVSARLYTERNPVDDATSREWRGYVSEIIPSQIHVPLPVADLISRAGTRPETRPRYTVTLHYGKGFEPWVADIKLRNP